MSIFWDGTFPWARGTHGPFIAMRSRDRNPLSSRPPPRPLAEAPGNSGVWAQGGRRRPWRASQALCGSVPLSPSGLTSQPSQNPLRWGHCWVVEKPSRWCFHRCNHFLKN